MGTNTVRLLIADDDCELIQDHVTRLLPQLDRYEIVTAQSPKDCKDALEDGAFDIVLLDVSFSYGKKEGIGLIPLVKKLSPPSYLVMLTSMNSVEMISQCMALGADDFISKKSLDNFHKLARPLEATLTRYNKREGFLEAGLKLAKNAGASFVSEAMCNVYADIARVRSQSRMHVLVTGPSGTGKELVAKAISRKADGAPYYPINSACFGKDLLESELFGHERGSFTGAERLKKGLFELASGGDIFFDEVATLAPDHQQKLLRVLQSGEFLRTGGETILRSSARVIAATNEDLPALVRAGRFREDLRQRFQRFSIRLPALKERKEDIPIIIQSVIEASDKKSAVITEDCLNVLMAYDWPCNARELEDDINAALLKSDGKLLTVGDLHKDFFEKSSPLSVAPVQDGEAFIYQEKIGTAHLAAMKRYSEAYIRAVAGSMRRPVSIGKLARVLEMPKSTLAKCITEFGIELNPEDSGETEASHA